MALTGTATTTPADLLAAILSTLQSEYTARAQPLTTIGLWSPETLRGDDGAIVLETPALLLEPGPSELLVDATAIGRSTYGEGQLIEWHAYHIVSSRRANAEMERDTWEMAILTCAILRAPDARGRRGQKWGLGDAVDVPMDSLSHEPVDLEAPGYACRRLVWQQAARFVDTYL